MHSLNLFASTGLVAKFVLFVLLLLSLQSWSILFSKWLILKKALAENSRFLNIFWNSQSLEDVMNQAEKLKGSPLVHVFKSGTNELKNFNLNESTSDRFYKLENIQRSLTRSAQSEIDRLERNVGWLATTASAAPFIGLFGTVWGIMTSFQNIGITGSANLGVVAPGISEALITTATGIAAAIPALMGYNALVQKIKRVATDLDCFSSDFLNLLQRSVLDKKSMADIPKDPKDKDKDKGFQV